jgi:prepilin-type N-terminal cleavage/methylation domain-containing protein
MLRKISRKGCLGDQRGFTLIEIIAVLVILAVLAAVAIPRYMSMVADSKTKAAMGAVAEGMGRVNQVVASHMLRNSGLPPTPAQVTGALTGTATDAGDFALSFSAAGTTGVQVSASGIGANVSGAPGTSMVVKLPSSS